MNFGPNSIEKPIHAFRADKNWTFQLIGNLIRPRYSFFKVAARRSRQFVVNAPPNLNPLFQQSSASLFVWIPKTAGTSIYRWIKSQRDILLVKEAQDLLHDWDRESPRGAVAFGSMNVDTLVKAGYLDSSVLEPLFSFAFVRNPYSRIASLYRYALKMGALPSKTPFRVFLWMVARQEPIPGLYNWAGLSMASPMVNWTRQNFWPGPKQIFRVEDGADAFRKLGCELGLRGLPGRENVTSASLAPVRFKRFETDLMKDIFFEDFQEFDYPTQPP